MLHFSVDKGDLNKVLAAIDRVSATVNSLKQNIPKEAAREVPQDAPEKHDNFS